MDFGEDFDESLLDEEALAFLIKHELNHTAAGITKQVMSDGLGNLTDINNVMFLSNPWWMNGSFANANAVTIASRVTN